jgi:acyl carrier protein
METTEEKVRLILNEICKINSSTKNLKLDDDIFEVGVDSISFIKVVLKLEEEFNVKFEDDNLDYNKFRTIKQLVDYLELA